MTDPVCARRSSLVGLWCNVSYDRRGWRAALARCLSAAVVGQESVLRLFVCVV